MAPLGTNSSEFQAEERTEETVGGSRKEYCDGSKPSVRFLDVVHIENHVMEEHDLTSEEKRDLFYTRKDLKIISDEAKRSVRQKSWKALLVGKKPSLRGLEGIDKKERINSRTQYRSSVSVVLRKQAEDRETKGELDWEEISRVYQPQCRRSLLEARERARFDEERLRIKAT
eukprot:CAMPEP_0116848006 /NCGR_PEP_ID=MMETSP0418-20121206/14749_1 /TAXON_ID=1158023 /ORGANISM="Astrosyne radiata, Strain 13vi08-1A" /LENGTH=171 /DNA_ID=CAMNT_0004479513 /DNA_START=14 /DNA_END=529 /DNA_ORIENTATION=+